MKTWNIAAVAALALALGACQTTQQASERMQTRWLGEPVDRFFIENGPPVSSFALGDGGTIYTWRGGEASYTRPAQIRTVPIGGAQQAQSRTSTTTSNPSPGTTVTRSQTVSTSFGITPTVTTVVRPAERVEIVCEAQIAVDGEGTITRVRISRDTQGAGFSLSRCAEIFGE